MSKCGYKWVDLPPDMEHGHIEHELVSLCGEDIACFDECYKHWGFCPFCGKPWPEQKPPPEERKETDAEIVFRAICSGFEPSPAQRAALALRMLGFTWEDLHRLYSEGQLSDLTYPQYNNTLNALRDIERNDI